MSNSLVLGPDPGRLIVRVVPGERMSASLILTDAETGDPTAWPEAPVLVFDSFDVTATLSATAAPYDVVADALATWDLTADQTTGLTGRVRLRVDDETWWNGRVQCQS